MNYKNMIWRQINIFDLRYLKWKANNDYFIERCSKILNVHRNFYDSFESGLKGFKILAFLEFDMFDWSHFTLLIMKSVAWYIKFYFILKDWYFNVIYFF